MKTDFETAMHKTLNSLLTDEEIEECIRKRGKFIIYQIKCTETGRIYVGRTKALHYRLSKHISALRSNRHKNHWLQRDFNRYGEKSFSYSILAINDGREINTPKGLETYWMKRLKTYQRKYGYNVCDPVFRGLRVDAEGENMALKKWAYANGLGDEYERYIAEKEDLAAECEAETGYSRGEDFELRLEGLRNRYPELFAEGYYAPDGDDDE